MKATLKLEDGREIQVELSEKDVDTIIKPKKTGWERVEPGQYYYHVAIGGDVTPTKEEQVEYDNLYYENASYFADRDLAKNQTRAISLWLRVKRWAAEHCKPIDWEDEDSCKYFISYDRATNEICDDGNFVYQGAFQIYFDTKEHAQQCIEEFRDELTWYFTECKDRVDG